MTYDSLRNYIRNKNKDLQLHIECRKLGDEYHAALFQYRDDNKYFLDYAIQKAIGFTEEQAYTNLFIAIFGKDEYTEYVYPRKDKPYVYKEACYKWSREDD